MLLQLIYIVVPDMRVVLSADMTRLVMCFHVFDELVHIVEVDFAEGAVGMEEGDITLLVDLTLLEVHLELVVRV